MITTALQGGLGNQLFQYAMGYAQAKRLGTELVLSAARFQQDGMRQYNLGIFDGVRERVIEHLNRPVVSEDGLPYNEGIVRSIKDGDTLLGYWQSEKYFQSYGDDIRCKFRSTQPWDEAAQYDKLIIQGFGLRSTFIGVRRTDYLKKLDYHGVMEPEYYREALRIIARRIGLVPEVFVFTDDVEWCANSLHLEYPFTIISPRSTTKSKLGREDIDLWLMATCKNAVIANSSFHWWGAWLGEAENVIAPKRWFATEREDSRDIVPERWIKI